MKNKSEIVNKYTLFGSKLRGTPYIENLLHDLLNDMETTENILKLRDGIVLDWEERKRNITILKYTFLTAEYLSLTDKFKIRPRIFSPPKHNQNSSIIKNGHGFQSIKDS